MYELLYLIAVSALFGYSMKVADLLDEHGLKWFRDADLLMGAAWGAFGSLLVLYDAVMANILLAMIAGFVLRRRLDYENHVLASMLIVISFLLFAPFDYTVFLPFFLVFVIFGTLKDYYDDVLHGKGWAFVLTEAMLYYPIPTAIYGVLTGAWMPFVAFTTYTLAYDFTKLAYLRRGIG
ncbi:Uncharacterised protein [Candidatus Burarchaeum australiense]|nr:Uncharacterised protein [Candidatus Burarchaeum australiense]